MPLKILHAIRSVNPSGGGPIEGVRQLTAMNTLLGHKVDVISLDDPSSEWVTKLGIKVIATGPGLSNYGYTHKYVEWLRENAHHYDCVIVNGIWGFNCFGTWLALRKTKVPYFVFTHGMLDPWFKTTFPLKHLKKWLYWPWGGYPTLRDARAVFFTCEEERRLARQSFWLYDCREFVLSYGTGGMSDPKKDYATPFLAKHPSLKGKRLFLFLGRVHPKKGPDLIIKAVHALLKEGLWNRETFKVVFAGPVDGAYAESLRALITQLGLEDVFYWTGMILGDEKWGAFQSAEAFLLPSHQENFGLAVAESLSAGTPVLLGKGVNIWPEIVHDQAGLAEPDTVKGCTDLMRSWLMLPERTRASMRENARYCYVRRYTAKQAANTFVAALYLLIGTQPKDKQAALTATAESC